MGDGIMLHRVMSAVPRFTFVPTNPNAAPGFTFINDGHGNWRIKFLTSGTLTFQSTLSHGIDVFLVGGGGGGATAAYAGWSYTGYGGSGYTKTQNGVPVTKGTAYAITIGGAGSNNSAVNGSCYAGVGGNSTAFGYTAYGGNKGKTGSTDNKYKAWAKSKGEEYPDDPNTHGNDGGCGGSGGATGNGTGGSNGGNASTASGSNNGIGQGTTTREFGEPTGDLYAQGGSKTTPVVNNSGNAGSSGIVVIRNHRE